MDIQQFSDETKGHFKAIEDGNEAGTMTYSRIGEEKIIIDHTEVNPEFKKRIERKNCTLSTFFPYVT